MVLDVSVVKNDVIPLRRVAKKLVAVAFPRLESVEVRSVMVVVANVETPLTESVVILVVAKLLVPVAVRVPTVRLLVEALEEKSDVNTPVVAFTEVNVGVDDTAIVEVDERRILLPAVR
jgi:hypothetical protein